MIPSYGQTAFGIVPGNTIEDFPSAEPIKSKALPGYISVEVPNPGGFSFYETWVAPEACVCSVTGSTQHNFAESAEEQFSTLKKELDAQYEDVAVVRAGPVKYAAYRSGLGVSLELVQLVHSEDSVLLTYWFFPRATCLVNFGANLR